MRPPEPKRVRTYKYENEKALFYNKLLKSQRGVCAICGKSQRKERKFAIDHHHGTGRMRGLLCFTCNAGLGLFRDSKSLLRQAIEYLKEHSMIGSTG